MLSSGFLLLSAGAAPAPQVPVLCPAGDKATTVPSSASESSHPLCHSPAVTRCRTGTELAPLGTRSKNSLCEVKAAINTEGFPAASPPPGRAGNGSMDPCGWSPSIHALLLQGGLRVARGSAGSREFHGAGLGGGHEVRGAALRGHLRATGTSDTRAEKQSSGLGIAREVMAKSRFLLGEPGFVPLP